MKTTNKILEYQTKGELEFLDITEEIKSFVKESQIQNGLINIQSLHTTAAVICNENEPLLLEDIKLNLRKIASNEINYSHDDFSKRTVNMCGDECRNGHSHCKAVYLPSSLTMNLVNGEMQLGQWQRILFLELDHSRLRKIQVQAIGE